MDNKNYCTEDITSFKMTGKEREPEKLAMQKRIYAALQPVFDEWYPRFKEAAIEGEEAFYALYVACRRFFFETEGLPRGERCGRLAALAAIIKTLDAGYYCGNWEICEEVFKLASLLTCDIVEAAGEFFDRPTPGGSEEGTNNSPLFLAFYDLNEVEPTCYPKRTCDMTEADWRERSRAA